MKTIAIWSLLLAFTQSALATRINGAHVDTLQINKSLGSMVFIKVDANRTPPTCQTNSGWSFVMPLVDKTDQAMLSILLTAKASNATVSIVGNDTCGTFGSVETATSINIEK